MAGECWLGGAVAVARASCAEFLKTRRCGWLAALRRYGGLRAIVGFLWRSGRQFGTDEGGLACRKARYAVVTPKRAGNVARFNTWRARKTVGQFDQNWVRRGQAYLRACEGSCCASATAFAC
jgi:hypothetical protein